MKNKKAEKKEKIDSSEFLKLYLIVESKNDSIS